MATIRPITLKSGAITYEIQVKASDKGSGRQVTKTMRWKPESGMTKKTGPSWWTTTTRPSGDETSVRQNLLMLSSVHWSLSIPTSTL